MKIQKIVPTLNPNTMMGFREQPIYSDVQGSYTGIALNSDEVPVQDADDL